MSFDAIVALAAHFVPIWYEEIVLPIFVISLPFSRNQPELSSHENLGKRWGTWCDGWDALREIIPASKGKGGRERNYPFSNPGTWASCGFWFCKLRNSNICNIVCDDVLTIFHRFWDLNVIREPGIQFCGMFAGIESGVWIPGGQLMFPGDSHAHLEHIIYNIQHDKSHVQNLAKAILPSVVITTQIIRNASY